MRPASNPQAAFMIADPATLVGTDCYLAVAAFRHEAITRRCLQRIKYDGAIRLASIMADLTLPALDRILAISGQVTLVPVPLHLNRQRLRGFNQSLLIARALARARGLAIEDVLVRRRETIRQHRLNRAERLQNMAAAIEMRAGAVGPGQVMLVDDIITTGATLEACAGVLKRSGSGAVYGIAIAREV
jgi:ComF family protein